MGSLGHVPSPLWALVSPDHWWGLDWMALKAPLISECVAQGCESGCFGEAGGSVCEMSGGGLCMGSCLSSCVCMSVFGVHLPVCGTCGCWCACTCSVALLCGNMCERACKHGCARDGHQWVSLGWWGWGVGSNIAVAFFLRLTHSSCFHCSEIASRPKAHEYFTTIIL